MIDIDDDDDMSTNHSSLRDFIIQELLRPSLPPQAYDIIRRSPPTRTILRAMMMIDHPEDWWSERRTIDHPLLSRPDDWWDYSPRYRVNYVSATVDDDTDSTSDDDQGADQLHNGHGRSYVISRTITRNSFDSLIDRGANGGLAGDDMRLIEYDEDRTIDVQGIDNHQVPQLRLGKFGAVAKAKQGDVLLIFCQHAHIQRGKSIHSSLQLEDNNITVNDRPIRLRGKQSLTTNEGYVLPLDFKRGLAYLKIRPYTNDEFIKLPHVYMTRDIPWVPSRYDAEPPRNMLGNEIITQDGFDEMGDLIEVSHSRGRYSGRQHPRGSTRSTSVDIIPQVPAILSRLNRQAATLSNRSYDTNSHIHHPVNDEGRILSYGEVSEGSRDYEELRQFFLHVPADVVRRTYDATTRFYRSIAAPTHIKQHHKTSYPACNVHRRNKAVATDTVFADVTAWGGWMCAQLYVGRTTRYVSLYGCKTDGQFVGTLQDEIRYRGAMNELISDRGGFFFWLEYVALGSKTVPFFAIKS